MSKYGSKRIRFNKETIKAALIDMAIDGYMPKIEDWDRDRGGLSGATTICVRWGKRWNEIADEIGLKTNLTIVKKFPSDYAFEQLKIMGAANGDWMPTLAEWDDNKPDDAPAGATITRRLDITWTELAEQLGLKPKYAKRRKPTEDNQREAEILAQLAQELEAQQPKPHPCQPREWTYEPEPLYRPDPKRALSKMVNAEFCMQNDFAGYKVR